MADAELRQRKAPAPEAEEKPREEKPRKEKSREEKLREKVEREDETTPWVDGLRVLTFLFVASCALSYLISSGESFFWGMQNKPYYLRLDWWKSHFVRCLPTPSDPLVRVAAGPVQKFPSSLLMVVVQEPPIELTPEELTAYDGTDPSKPIYLAINGSIFDVTPGARIYGPGGSYHWFAGCDASRAYVTGCFAEDRTPDMRGVEEMFLPLEDPEANAKFTKEELSGVRKEELAEARRRVHEALGHWVGFFEKSDKYRKVGSVKREKGWLKELPRRELCEGAHRGRKPRKVPEKGQN